MVVLVVRFLCHVIQYMEIADGFWAQKKPGEGLLERSVSGLGAG
jgi:hypothetical protein